MKKFTLLFITLFVAISAFADYYVAGSPSLCGSNWSNNDANNKMTLTNGVYVKSYANVPAGSHEFKITNGTWDNAKGYNKVDAATSTSGYNGQGDGNISFILANSTNITISYNESTDKITLKAEGVDKFGEFIINSYTLCGDFPCLDWNTANTANHMTKGENGIWTKTYENVTLDAKKYKYKVAANNAWGNGEFPTSGGNNEYEIKEAGAYNLTFKYNPAKPELTCEATLVGAAEVILYPENTTIYVTVHTEWTADNARFAAYFFGSNGDTWTDLTKVNDAIYSLTVPAGEWYGMIICRMNPNNTENRWNNDGEENGPVWGAQTQDIKYEEGKNHYVINSEDPTWDGNKPGGSWTTYNSENDNPGGNDDPEKPQPEATVYTLCGDSIIFGSKWNETDTNNDMTKGEDGIWAKEYHDVTLAKGTYEYKVVADHNWDTAGKYPSDDTNMTLYIAKEGVYDLKFTFDPTVPELKVTTDNKVNIENVTINNIYAINGFVYADTDITIYTLTGQDVTSQNGNLTNGIYIIKTQNTISKLIIK